jgi:hypothetical protein
MHGSLERIEELGGSYPEAFGQAENVHEGDVALTALHAADIVAMEVG